jgi:hypothetical protein
VSLWSYNTEEDFMISNLNNNIILRFKDYITYEPYLTFIGCNNILDTLETLFKQEKEEGIEQILKMIPADNFVNINEISSYYHTDEDRNNFDYILSVDDTAKLAGHKYHTQKNHINRFLQLII